MKKNEMGINAELLTESTKVTMSSNDYYRLLKLASYGVAMQTEIKEMGTYSLEDHYSGNGVKTVRVNIPVLLSVQEQIAAQLAERLAADDEAMKACVVDSGHYFEITSRYIEHYNFDNDKIDLMQFPKFKERYEYWAEQQAQGVELFSKPAVEDAVEVLHEEK